MNEVGVPSSKLIAPLLVGIAILAIQTASPLTTLPMGLMIALAGVIHMTAMAMRDAEFRALISNHGLNAQDVFAYGCMVLFDALLLFGLVSGAGRLLPWSTFLSISGFVVLIMPAAVYFVARNHYAPKTALKSGGMRHWAPPLLLIAMAFVFSSYETLQLGSGSQPYTWLVLLSVILAATDPKTTFDSQTRIIRLALVADLFILLIWNYFNI